MKNEEIEQGNKLIAEFMGFDFSKSGLTARKGKGSNPSPYRLKDLHYHSSWNLLMPVVEQMESIGVFFNINRNFVTVSGYYEIGSNNYIHYQWFGGSTSDSKIISLWHAVVQFASEYLKAFNPL